MEISNDTQVIFVFWAKITDLCLNTFTYDTLYP